MPTSEAWKAAHFSYTKSKNLRLGAARNGARNEKKKIDKEMAWHRRNRLC